MKAGPFARALALGLLASGPPGVLADPDEAWIGRAGLPAGTRPLLALLIDDSLAAGAAVDARPAYDPGRDYAAAVAPSLRCVADAVYWRRGSGHAPDCATQVPLARFPASAALGLQCRDAQSALARHGFYVASRAAQWRARGPSGYWAALDARSAAAVECRGDRGGHGAAPGAWYAAAGAAGPWSRNPADEIDWDRPPHADAHLFYLGNYLNYLRADLPVVATSAIELARRGLAAALDATDALDVAAIRFPPEGMPPDGGFVFLAPVASATAAASIAALDATPAAGAPLAEGLAEAAAWIAGIRPHFGDSGSTDPEAIDAATGRYRSPFTHACRPVTLAVVTPGIPSDDESAAAAAGALPGFAGVAGDCADGCLGALVRWLDGPDLIGGLAGAQSVELRWLLGNRATNAVREAAIGRALSLHDPLAYAQLVLQAHQRDAAVPAAPRLSTPSFLTGAGGATAAVLGLGAARPATRWLGNLYRYRLESSDSPLAPPRLAGRDGEAALDPENGLPSPASRSDWSDAMDSELLRGGAAGRVPAPGARRIHSDVATVDLADPRNRIEPGNPHLDRAMFGLVEDDPQSPDDVAGWLQSLRTLGDLATHAPVIAGGGAAAPPLVLAASQDGLLHAFDAESGVERWAFLPRALLPRLPALARDAATTVRDHGWDAPLVLHRHDPDGDDVVDAGRGEHLRLYAGLGRGGNAYYALDLSAPDAPRLLWTAALPGPPELQAQAAPVVARLRIADSGQSAGDWILLVPGGHDPHDDFHGPPAEVGRVALQLLDAATGRTLWTAGSAEDLSLRLPEPIAATPSAPRAIDSDGDGMLDRAWLLDAAGDLWRFDFRGGRPPAELAQARRMARLGDGRQRFQAAPDLAVARIGGRDVYAIAAGSGWAARPRDTAVEDRVAVVFDRDHAGALLAEDLHDVTERGEMPPPDAPGWTLRLDRHGPGEKVIGSPVTFDHLLRFQTYEPLAPTEAGPCGPPRALHRLYARDIRTGLPHSAAAREDGLEREVEAPGLPVELRYGFPDRALAPCPGCIARPFGAAGEHLFDAGFDRRPVKTSWRKLTATADSP